MFTSPDLVTYHAFTVNETDVHISLTTYDAGRDPVITPSSPDHNFLITSQIFGSVPSAPFYKNEDNNIVNT